MVPIEILQLVDQFETLLNRSWRIPFTSSLLVNEQECLRLLDQMRTAIPEEIRQARRALAERDRLIAQAQEESQRIVALAREQAISSLDDREIMREAENRAAAIIAEAQEQARTLEDGARDYALQVLRDLSNELQRVIRQVNNGVERLQVEMGKEEQRSLVASVEPPLTARHKPE